MSIGCADDKRPPSFAEQVPSSLTDASAAPGSGGGLMPMPGGPVPGTDASSDGGTDGVVGNADAGGAGPVEPTPAPGPADGDGGVVEPLPLDAATEPTPSAVCGDGIVDDDADEECDGDSLLGANCFTLGFTDGTLKCAEDCTLDVSECSGAENCSDGRDNDGDGLVDCFDEECAAACDNGCTSPHPLGQEPIRFSGTLLGHSDDVASDCDLQPGGADVIHSLTAEYDGILDVRLQSTGLLAISLQSSCSADAGASAELGCVLSNRLLREPVAEGDEIYIAVSARRAVERSRYEFSAQFRPILCGDGFQDGTEECDDKNNDDGDGCGATCLLESDETEPNESLATASAFTQPYRAYMSASDDQDFVQFTLGSDTDWLRASLGSVGEGQCTLGLIDSVLELIDADGDVLARDDDGGERFCSALELQNLPSGTYWLRVTSIADSPVPFPYQLGLAQSTCGDSVTGFKEECDDGNRVDGDGCSSDCLLPN